MAEIQHVEKKITECLDVIEQARVFRYQGAEQERMIQDQRSILFDRYKFHNEREQQAQARMCVLQEELRVLKQ